VVSVDATNEIVAEADSVAEARQQAERQVPSGMQVLGVKENWPSAGTVRAAADANGSARERAYAQVPEGATIISETLRPAGETVYVYASDLRDAVERLGATYGKALARGTVGLSVDGRIGRALNRIGGPFGYSMGQLQFRAELVKPFAELSYRTKARVALTFGPEQGPVGRPRPGGLRDLPAAPGGS
jgi:hypothetical protein